MRAIDVIAVFEYCYPRRVLALLDPLKAVRRYDIPDVRDHYFNRADRYDDRRHVGLLWNNRGAYRRLHWNHRVHYAGTGWESGVLRCHSDGCDRWMRLALAPYHEASS